MSLLTMLAAAPIVGLLAIVDPASAAGDSISISRLVEIINNRSTLPAREDAAVQLVNRNTPDAISAADLILKNNSNRGGQIAIARAVARAVNPDPVYIRDLGVLLGTDAVSTQAAAGALANYDGHPEAFDPLRNFADNNANALNLRIAAINAMGSIVDLHVAGYLIDLLSKPAQTAAIQNAATDALTALTEITAYGNDVHQWQQWWNAQAGKPPDPFRAELLAARYKRLKERNAELTVSASDHLTDNYNDIKRVDPAAATQVLLSYLDDRTPEIRITGVELINQTFTSLDRQVRNKLLLMISDPEDNVRLGVVGALLNLNDHNALPALLQQLKVEKNLQIRVKLAQALGKLEDLTALPALLELLRDRDPELVTAAAKALSGNLGTKLRRENPGQADQVSADLRRIIDAPIVPGTDEMRAACVSALAALQDKLSFNTFMLLVQPAQSSEIRQAALRGLGNLHDTRANEVIADQLDDNDRRVRYEAATALQTTATPDQAQFIFQRMKHNPAANDPDKDLSDALWIAFQNLYAKQSPADLNRWATDLADAPDKRLVTLQRLGDALAAANDAQGVAQNQQEIADAMMAVKPPRILDAIASLQKALDYWRGPGKGDSDKLEGLIGSELDDLLLAGQYVEATNFSARQIAFNPVYQQTVGPRIKNKADELSNKNPADAKVLIDAALQMKPPLDDRYVGALRDIQNLMKQRETTPPG